MNDIAISVKNVGKRYQIYANNRARLKHAFMPSSTQGITDLWALQDISFDIKRGESVAIIGRNGSGKSTLLEIITGTLTPTTGSVQTNGRIAALLELGSGFNPEYSGRENVYLNGLLLGLSRADITRHFDEIVSFADIGDVLDRPVKTYSSGMLVRLAFSVQVALEPDILIVDEALSVGDFFFQQKCMERIRELQATGTTVLFVSHDMQTVRDLCQKGLLLSEGQQIFWGSNLTAINHYLNQRHQPHISLSKTSNGGEASPKNNGLDTTPAALWKNASPTTRSILEVEVYNSLGQPTRSVTLGDELRVNIRYCDKSPTSAYVMLTLKNRLNQIVTAQGTFTTLINRPPPTHDFIFEIQVRMECNVEAGEYSITVSLAESQQLNTGEILHETPPLGPLRITWDYQNDTPPFFGLCGIPVSIAYTEKSAENDI